MVLQGGLMVQIVIDGDLAERLQSLAVEQKRTVEEVLETLLTQRTSNTNWAVQMALMAEADTDIEWRDSASHLSEQSRDILNNEYADYLAKRARDNGAE
jgi:hypothetical protein